MNTFARLHLHNPSAVYISVLELTPAPPLEALQSAIDTAVRRDTALLCAYDRDDCSESLLDEPGYTLLAADLEFDDDWMDVVQEQQRIPLDITSGETARFILLEGAESVQIIIMTHAIIGGIEAATETAQAVLKALDGEEPGSPERSLPTRTKLGMAAQVAVNAANRGWQKMRKRFSESQYDLLFKSFWDYETTFSTAACDYSTFKASSEKLALHAYYPFGHHSSKANGGVWYEPTLIDAAYYSANDIESDPISSRAATALNISSPKDISYSEIKLEACNKYSVKKCYHLPPYCRRATITAGMAVMGEMKLVTMQYSPHREQDAKPFIESLQSS